MDNQIATRIAELKQAREAYVAQANQQIGAFNGGIAELERLQSLEAQPESAPNIPQTGERASESAPPS